MAAEDDKISYSDIVTPDDSITKLISQLEALTKQYDTMINAIRAGAKEIVAGMKSASGATKEGRAAIDDSVIAANRLERAQKELKFSLSDIGREVAWLKQQTKENNIATVEQQKAIRALSTSYDKLQLELQDNIRLWKAMTEAERQDASYGGQVLQNIHNLQAQVKSLDNELKLHVTALTEVQRAEQKLNFLRSEEGQRLLALRQEINEVIAASKGEKATKDELTRANERLNYVMSDYYKEVQQVTRAANEQARIKRLEIQLNNSAVGSYNQLAAQYELNKIKLNAMSQEERRAVDIGQKLEAETKRIYQQMIFLQEATGNHRLSVGNYAKAWNGLGNSMNQIMREIPAMTMGINMFFLAISNNVPILIDELQRVRRQNQLLRAEGKPTENIMKTITSSIFGWQTALILLMTAMAMHGKKIIEFGKQIIGVQPKIRSTIELHKELTKELEKTNGSYGQNIVSLKKLQSEWNKLTSDKEKEKWVKNTQSEWSKLGIAVDNVSEAENVLVDNTDAVVNALRLRAKAAAAQNLAAESYEKALIKQREAEQLEEQKQESKEKYREGRAKRPGGAGAAAYATPGAQAGTRADDEAIIEQSFEKRIRQSEEAAKVAEAEADAYFDVADALEAEAAAGLKAAGIKSKNLKDRKERTRRGRQPRDLTDVIDRNDVTLEKKYEESITRLQNDEFLKRRKSLQDATQNEINELELKKKKNEEYIANAEGKYKELTEEQKKQIAQQQEWINQAIINAETKLKFDLLQLEKERQIAILKTMRETIEWQLDDITNSIEDEKKLKLRQLAQEENFIKQQNILAEDGGRDEAEITAEYAKKRLKITSEYDDQILAIKKADIASRIAVVRRGSKDELDLLLKQNEIERQLALSANRAKPASQQQSVAQINQSFDRKATTIKTDFQMTGFDQQQALDEARFNEVKRSEMQITRFRLQQEKDRWIEQIRLAEAGSLDWSQTQIDAAKSTVKGIDRELSELNNFIANIGKKGLGGSLLEKLGFDDDQISALQDAVNIVLEQFQAILAAEVELAEKAVELSEKRVEAAQNAYDAEVEARNNGYANNVATAKKELEQEKKNQQQKQKILEQAQRRQEALNSVIQASSLITASANLWSSFSGMGPLGPAFAIAAIAAMWGSFAAAKIKAMQVTSQAQEYGEGGLEFLEGGSHASGNDIDLGIHNKRKRRMKAEGGEALAIVNKKNTRKYKRVLPDIIDSLNKGNFEDKYLNAFNTNDSLTLSVNSNSQIDLSKIESDVSNIRKQRETQYFTMPDGTTVIQRKNIRKIIHK